MSSRNRDYGVLVRAREEWFPNFDEDQAFAAKAIAKAIRPLLRSRRIGLIVDLGCGTGDILANLRHDFRHAQPTLRYLGIDPSEAQVKLARRRRKGCSFQLGRAEQFERVMRRVVSLRNKRVAILCVGHTITHFQKAKQFFADVRSVRPTCIVVDFHETWDSVIGRLSRNRGAELREKKSVRSRGTSQEVQLYLTTKTDQANSHLVIRGVEARSTATSARLASFWTTQLRKPSSWYRQEFERCGYAIVGQFRYDAGYGPMRAMLFLSTACDVIQSMPARAISR